MDRFLIQVDKGTHFQIGNDNNCTQDDNNNNNNNDKSIK